LFRENGLVVANEKIAPGHWCLTVKAPRVSRKARPGQFAQIECCPDGAFLLPRPFSFLSVEKDRFSVLYQVVGKGTRLLAAKKKGELLKVLGPLGNGFSPAKKKGDLFLLIGGGVGIPPLAHLARNLLDKRICKKEDLRVLLGARSKDLVLCEKEFKHLGVSVETATDDGSKGKKGFVTDLFSSRLCSVDPFRVQTFACGPTPMLRAVSILAMKFGVRCEISLETPMACGFGACMGCAVKVREGEACGCESGGQKKFKYALACKEGPVFKAEKILWE